MRLVRYGDDRAGAIVERSGRPMAVDLEATLDDLGCADWRLLIGRWDEVRLTLEQQVAAPDSGLVHDLEAVALRPPLPAPTSRIFALGVNFSSHVASAARAVGVRDPTAAGGERPPAGFFVIPGTVVGPEAEISPPSDAQKVDYEAEVAVVLACGGRDLEPEDVRFWGHTGFNDVSIRDPHLGLSRLDEGSLAWGLQKNFDGGNVLGPCIVVDEGHDLANLSIRSRVNGEQRQDGSTAEMLRSFAGAAVYLSRYLRLEPGDLLTSGTPSGTAIEQGMDGPYLQPGDVIEVEIEGAGILRNRFAGGNPR
jgi:2-keto-4-pentenoate hydratase/2-oxohepta-3-ene-1,7-dioic acid hydratase in catechol pathway